MVGHVQQVSGKALTYFQCSAVRTALCPRSRNRVKADGKPERTCPPKSETPKQPEQSYAQAVHPLHGLEKIMHCAKDGRQQDGRWPEAHSAHQRCLRVTAVREFLSEA